MRIVIQPSLGSRSELRRYTIAPHDPPTNGGCRVGTKCHRRSSSSARPSCTRLASARLKLDASAPRLRMMDNKWHS
ncbi:hypothetical protein C8F01DRAFT_1256513 [Mycena amicta]|nr:hypothetical protein C8F01DRAFT_1256513 [Mycena amicta]